MSENQPEYFCLGDFPDIILVEILSYLSITDIISLGSVYSRINQLSGEKPVAKVSSFEDCFLLKEKDFKAYIQKGRNNIRALHFNHCYWLPQRLIHWSTTRCTNLTSLHVIECRLRSDMLLNILASHTHLQSLAFSISSFAEVHRERFEPVKDSLQFLKHLSIYYSQQQKGYNVRYLGEHATLLDYCPELETLHLGSASFGISELYRPIITNTEQFAHLHTMTITPNIHAESQMFFYGTLSQLHNHQIRWKKLLMPNINLKKFPQLSAFQRCLTNVASLHSLDMSGSMASLPADVLGLSVPALTHLNLKCTLLESDQLDKIVNGCYNLTSVNLCGCPLTLTKSGAYNLDGLRSLVKLPKLRHFNFSGDHYHLKPSVPVNDDISLYDILIKLKDLSTLSLAVCTLCSSVMTSQRKRTLDQLDNSRPSYNPSKRQCVQKIQSAESQLAPGRRISRVSSTQPVASQSVQPSTSSVASSNTLVSNTLLNSIVEHNPYLKEFELIATKFESVIHQNLPVKPPAARFHPCDETRFVRDSDIESISKLTHLERLTLAGLPGLVSCHSLQSITTECQMLHYLSLAYIGTSTLSNTLVKALPKCLQLRHLRIEQPYMTLNQSLFQAISCCTMLQRLCIIAKRSDFQAKDVQQLMENSTKLVVLHMFAGGYAGACKSLTLSLKEKFVKSRPGMSISIFPLIHYETPDIIDNLPARHLEELTRFDTHVCV